jgi:hypothetical protein
MTETTRRAFLRGAAGATLSLPWLDSLAGPGSTPKPKPATRLAFFYVPIGVVRRGFFPGEAEAVIPTFSSDQQEVGEKPAIPVGLHPLRDLTPTQQPLAAVREKVTLVTGMDRFYQHGSDVHAQCASCFLSSATAHEVESSVYPLARTLDHVVADHIGHATPFRTLELSCNSHRDNKESIYFDNVSWYGTNHVAPSIRDPRKVYHRLFGTRETREDRNVTDLVLEDARGLRRLLGRDDRAKFAEYLDGIRTIEERMDKLERMKGELAHVQIEEPPEAHLPRGEYIRLMGDLMIAALQSGLTNVATLMVGPERWDTPFLYESLFERPMSHHQMSHNQRQFIDQLLQVDRFHMEQFAYLVGRMDAIDEADGRTLLDNTLFTYGSGLGDGATHQYTDLPIVVAGSGGGRLRTGRHLHCPDGTPLANLWLTQAHVLALDLDRFADGTRLVDDLLV